MQLTINDEIREFSKVMTLQQLVEHLALKTQGVAVAVNQQVISQKCWSSYELQENDAVFIIRATHGG